MNWGWIVGAFVWGICLIILTGGIHTSWVSAKQVYRGFVSFTWPKANGIVVNSRLSEEHRPYEAGSGIYNPLNFLFQLRVEYEFKVSDTSYSGRRFYAFGQSDLDDPAGRYQFDPNAYTTVRRREAAKMASRYQTGNKVAVYYDPRDPSNCALLCGPAFTSIGGLVLGAFGILLGSIPFLFWLATMV